MVNPDEFEAVNRRAERRRNTEPRAVDARYDERLGRVVVTLSNGIELLVPPETVEGLAGAKPGELARIEITPSGFGLHFPALDADVYLPGLLQGELGSRRWMAAELGRAGGKARSGSKAAASRRNGARGGRPRKSGMS